MGAITKTALAAFFAAGCARVPAVTPAGNEGIQDPPDPPPASLALPDKGTPDHVPDREAEQVARASFPRDAAECGDGDGATRAWVKSSIRGSFTSPRSAQVMYFVRTYGCDDLKTHGDVVVVYQGGREIWRTAGREPILAVDLDGDGKDEWVEEDGRCDPGCAAERWTMGYASGRAVELAHVTP